ncbi:hypothetical protein DRE_03347 [Drechslerella stenobrocha 248]|uniref:Rhodopsin domain-containing protein n=1 Tax=Drechslerella stenobrocha 248 TaxID=1043628 RepID=W7I4X8_9PEZI|nr:hypothetical protein DRE_03347 [Drechslerella stenobrocha 248]
MLSVAGTFRGGENHINELEDSELIYILKLLYAEVILQPVTLNLIKLSILSFYLRLPGSNRFRLLTKATYALVLMMMLAFIFTLALACIPVRKQWDPYETGGNCINRSLFWHIILALNVATNLWILLLPARMLLGLRVARRQKVMVLCIFGVGSIATIASILALVELPLAIDDPDKTWGSWRLAVYAAVQNNLGIIAASAPALKPLVGKTVRKVKDSVSSILSTMPWSPRDGSSRTRSRASTAPTGVYASNTTPTASHLEKRTLPLPDHDSHMFHISEAVRNFVSPREPPANNSQGGTDQTGNTSYHTALGSRSHRDSAVLDTIGILPAHAAFPRIASGNGREATLVSASADNGGSADIHHIRDWQLDKNDYCLDPTVKHSLPQWPRRAYGNRESLDSSPGLVLETAASGRTSQANSMDSAISPTDIARNQTPEAPECCADATAGGRETGDLGNQPADRGMPHE